jgi:hypothetical protein
MHKLVLSLGAIGSLGVMALGGRAIEGDRAAHAPRVAHADAAPGRPTASVTDRLWYGGTLAPIEVVAVRPDAVRSHRMRDCPTGGS